MQEGMLPLFPLEAVLLPHAPLPLHIFEERYKELIGECLTAHGEFGVVLARGNGILRIGCTASIDAVLKRYEDGRLDILAMGRQRFQIADVNTDRAFLRGKVEFLEDEDATPAPLELRRKALASHMEMLRLTESEEEPPTLDESDLSFRLAQISPDLDFRQMLLGLMSEQERMGKVADHLEILILRHHTQGAMKRVIRQNGHGTHLGDLSGRS
jgi:Lon protease-like protein